MADVPHHSRETAIYSPKSSRACAQVADGRQPRHGSRLARARPPPCPAPPKGRCYGFMRWRT
jgi:hypothetical protein